MKYNKNGENEKLKSMHFIVYIYVKPLKSRKTFEILIVGCRYLDENR